MATDSELFQAIEVAKREILEKLASDEPWLFSEPDGLYHMARKMPNGKKTFTIKVTDGYVEEVVIHTSIRNTYKRHSP